MSASQSTHNARTRHLSGRARAGIWRGTGLAAAVAAAMVFFGAAGASASDEHPIDEPLGGPASAVVEGSSESDAVGLTDPATGVTVIEGDMLIAPETGSL